MGENSGIQWTHHTFNAWEGCQRVSPGCEHCYAEARDQRFTGGKHWGPNGVRRRTSAANWKKPLAWNKRAALLGVRERVFCASIADVFEDRPELAPWREELFRLITWTPNLDWLLLTKRPENIARLMPYCEPNGGPYPNVWLGTTVEDQKRADERIPHLLGAQAAVRFLSCEPLLEPVDLRLFPLSTVVKGREMKASGIDWCIIGGESGREARHFDLAAGRDLVRQCRAAGVAPFVKQLGAIPVDRDSLGADQWALVLKDKAGGDPAEWPADLRVREFPVVPR